jgi:hypothetical protein
MIMKGLIIPLFLIVSVLFPAGLIAQEEHDHDHESQDDHHQKNEIGGAIGMFFDLEEQRTASGFHLHYTRMMPGKLRRFGISPGVEFIFGEHRHYAFQFMLIYRPTHGWWIGAGPGVSYFDDYNEFQASGHVETGYEFDAGKVHFGPVIEYSWAKEAQHIMLGLHLGVPF